MGAAPDKDLLTASLRELGGDAAYCALRWAPLDAMRIEVRGVGPLALPISARQAKELCAVAHAAPYGRGEETLLDPEVRRTWEVPRSRVKIDRGWDLALSPALERFRGDLGLAEGGSLRAVFHSLLVYAPGHHFLPHQDSEVDGMVGSLVVSLPSTFTGGELEVEHLGRTSSYRGSNKTLSMVAFYSDCRHQVKQVRSGYRVVLTYDLVLQGGARALATRDPATGAVAKLAGHLDGHFAGVRPASRLVYLLDHEYTPRGLGWSGLKGADADRGAALRAAAEAAGCEAVLALADVRETWGVTERRPPQGWRRGWQSYDEEDDWDDEGGEEGDYDLEELLQSTVVIDSWLGGPGGRWEPVELAVRDHEVCASTPSEALIPYTSEYEGYMGNYGNTLDRWYHRGAVIVLPATRGSEVRAEVSPAWALDHLDTLLRAGNVAEAEEVVDSVAPFWARRVAAVGTDGFPAAAMRTAARLGPGPAAALLAPLGVEVLTPATAETFSALVNAHGTQWAAHLVASWSDRPPSYQAGAASRPEWITSLPRLCTALVDQGEAGRRAAEVVLVDSWGWLRKALGSAVGLTAPTRRAASLVALGRPIAGLLRVAAATGAHDVVGEAAAWLGRDEHVGRCTIEVLRVIPAPRWDEVGIRAVAARHRQMLEERLARPERAAGDWSVPVPAGCQCDLCTTLAAYLADPDRRVLEWPIAKAGRAHIHNRVDLAELPVSH